MLSAAVVAKPVTRVGDSLTGHVRRRGEGGAEQRASHCLGDEAVQITEATLWIAQAHWPGVRHILIAGQRRINPALRLFGKPRLASASASFVPMSHS